MGQIVTCRVLAIALTVAGLVPATARAATCLPDLAASDNDPFAYLKSVVQSLNWAGQGLAYEEKPFDGSWARAVYNLKSAREYYACGSEMMARFVESKADMIKRSTQLVIDAYDLLRLSNEQAE